MLENADAERWNDYERRGALSQNALNVFCEFFLQICEDQIEYMHSILKIDDLAKRCK
jgi:hypothetical protein